MFNNLRIKNYRLLQQVEFQTLSHVNLLAGRNNVGKSTLLEAVGLFAKLGSPLFIEELLVRRDDLLKVSNPGEKFYLPVERLFHGGQFSTQDDHGIYIGDFDDKESLKMSRFSDKLEGTFASETKLKITAKNSLLASPSVAHLFDDGSAGMLITELPFENYDREPFKQIESYLADKPMTYPTVYVPTGLMDSNSLAETWDSIALSSDEQAVIDALKFMEPKVERFGFVKNKYDGKRVAIIKVTGGDIPISIRNLGDGTSRVLQLILSLLQVKNGFLLIDEFENGLHYSVQPKVWNMLFILAKKFNTQIFATTHSKDTVESFGKIWRQDEKAGSFHRLSLKKGMIRAVAYDSEMLDTAITGDIEVR